MPAAAGPPPPDRRRRIADLSTHPDAFLTLTMFARYLGVGRRMVRKWIRAGVLPAYRFEGQWRINKKDAIVFVERAKVPPEDGQDGA